MKCTIHMKAVGPWTREVLKETSKALHSTGFCDLQVRVHGPYGTTEDERWRGSQVVVLIAGERSVLDVKCPCS